MSLAPTHVRKVSWLVTLLNFQSQSSEKWKVKIERWKVKDEKWKVKSEKRKAKRVFSKSVFSKRVFSKSVFFEMYSTCVSSKLCEFILLHIPTPQLIQKLCTFGPLLLVHLPDVQILVHFSCCAHCPSLAYCMQHTLLRRYWKTSFQLWFVFILPGAE